MPALAMEWAALHRDELQADWELARQQQPLNDIEGLSHKLASTGTKDPNGVDFCPDVLYSRATGQPIPFAAPEKPRTIKS